jgi:hypothetical protein
MAPGPPACGATPCWPPAWSPRPCTRTRPPAIPATTPHLAACLKALRDGDTLLVWKLDRLGGDLGHLVNIVHEFTERGVGLKVLTGQGGHRHHHRFGQAGVRDLRGPGRGRT